MISFGRKGSGDITGTVRNTRTGLGVRLELEIKTGQAVQEPDQINFERMCREMGAAYQVVRSVEEALAFAESIRDK